MSYYLVAPVPENPNNGRDLFWQWDKKQAVCVGFLNREYAEGQATQMSQSDPGTQYGVFQVVSLFETRRPETPPVLRKKVTESGEILPEGV